MKTEFTDVSDTQKTLTIEIPRDIVDAEINRVARGYSRQARIPGFRPGKVPATLVKQRFKDQILHDVMHGLIPRAVEEALQERGIEPVDTPNVKDVDIREGQPLKFTAAFETVPPFDPGDYSTLTLRNPDSAGADESVESATWAFSIFGSVVFLGGWEFPFGSEWGWGWQLFLTLAKSLLLNRARKIAIDLTVIDSVPPSATVAEARTNVGCAPYSAATRRSRRSTCATCAVGAPMSVSTPSRRSPSDSTNCTGSRASCGTVKGATCRPSMKKDSRPLTKTMPTPSITRPSAFRATMVP